MIKICFGVGRVRSLVREVPYTSRCGQNKQLQFCWVQTLLRKKKKKELLNFIASKNGCHGLKA